MTNFIWYPGTSNDGKLATNLSLMTTELNALASGAYAISTSTYTNSNTAQAMWGMPVYTFGATVTPAGSQNVSLWFAESLDGTTFESASALLARSPDAVFSFAASSYAAGQIVIAQGRIVRVPALKFKVVAQNNIGGSLGATGNTIVMGLFAEQY